METSPKLVKIVFSIPGSSFTRHCVGWVHEENEEVIVICPVIDFNHDGTTHFPFTDGYHFSKDRIISITVLEEAGEEIKIKPPIHLQLQCKKEGA